jgi:hypothetical protein
MVTDLGVRHLWNITAPSVLPLEVVPHIVIAVESLTRSLSGTGALDLEVSKALRVSFS